MKFSLWLGVVCFALAPVARAQVTGELTVLRSFNGVNGQEPVSALTLGSDGNFYGISPEGGPNNAGTVFRAAPDGSLTLLHGFDSSTDGYIPQCKLLLASDGNFYGTASQGGPGNGSGTVFKMTPDGTVSVLHTFSFYDDPANGYAPLGGVIQGNDGKLNGTTSRGGNTSNNNYNGDGTIFQLSLDGTFVLLHAFNFRQTGNGPSDPESSLVQGSDGNFYGVAAGGDNAFGAIYKMTPDGTVTTIHSFARTDGSAPVGALVEDGSGVFYGTTAAGGSASNAGTIFKVTAAGQFTSLHTFSGDDGRNPRSGLTLAADGNLYGTTNQGGSSYYGNIFQCTPDGTVTNLHTFYNKSSSVHGGSYPVGSLVQAADGSFYGVTQRGGPNDIGTVYRLTVGPHPPFFDGEVDLASGVEYLQFPGGSFFGYYTFLTDPHYVYHFDLGYEYAFDASDGKAGVYLYDFKSRGFFYTSPSFPFPYLYDFSLGTVLYYYPDLKNAGHYNTDGVRYFYNFATGKIISK